MTRGLNRELILSFKAVKRKEHQVSSDVQISIEPVCPTPRPWQPRRRLGVLTLYDRPATQLNAVFVYDIKRHKTIQSI